MQTQHILCNISLNAFGSWWSKVFYNIGPTMAFVLILFILPKHLLKPKHFPTVSSFPFARWTAKGNNETTQKWKTKRPEAWSSLGEGDEQPDHPQQSNMFGKLPCMCSVIYFELVTNTTAYRLGWYSLHLLLLKSSMPRGFLRFSRYAERLKAPL